MENQDETTDRSDEFAARLTKISAIALRSMPPDDVVLGAMTAALNVALDLLPRQHITDWLRRLADEIEKDDPARWAN